MGTHICRMKAGMGRDGGKWTAATQVFEAKLPWYVDSQPQCSTASMYCTVRRDKNAYNVAGYSCECVLQFMEPSNR